MKDWRDILFVCLFDTSMADEQPMMVDLEIELVVSEALKAFPGFEALMANPTKRLADDNQE